MRMSDYKFRTLTVVLCVLILFAGAGWALDQFGRNRNASVVGTWKRKSNASIETHLRLDDDGQFRMVTRRATPSITLLFSYEGTYQRSESGSYQLKINRFRMASSKTEPFEREVEDEWTVRMVVEPSGELVMQFPFYFIESRMRGSAQGLDSRGIVFGSFQSTSKTPQRVWRDWLIEVERSDSGESP